MDITPLSTTSRFLRKSQLKPSANIARVNAFYPNPNNLPLALSVYMTDGLNDTQIWAVAHEQLEKKNDINIVARAELKVKEIESQSLTVDYDNNPPHHANILGWPEPPPKVDGVSGNERNKRAWLHIATKFVNASKISRKESPPTS